MKLHANDSLPKKKFRLLLTVIPLLSKLFVKQSVRNSPPIGEDATACEKKRKEV